MTTTTTTDSRLTCPATPTSTTRSWCSPPTSAARSSPSGTSAARWTMRPTSRGRRYAGGAKLARWRRELAACFEGGTPRDAAGAGAGAVHRAVQAAARGVRGAHRRRRDGPRRRRYETFADLYQVLHSRGVRGRPDLPGDLRLPRSAARAVRHRPRRRAAAHQHPARRARGSRRGRVYIPQEDLRAHGVTEADLRAEMRSHAGPRCGRRA